MIRVMSVDDHPALRAGLRAVLQMEPGLVSLDGVSTEEELWPALTRSKPDVVLMDYHLPGTDGLQLCSRIVHQMLPPRVLIYSAYAGPELTVPAMIAGASGIVGKDVDARDLFDSIRRAARGEILLPPLTAAMREEAAGRTDAEDGPLLSMALDGATPAEIAEVLHSTPEDVIHRMRKMISQLRVEAPTS